MLNDHAGAHSCRRWPLARNRRASDYRGSFPWESTSGLWFLYQRDNFVQFWGEFHFLSCLHSGLRGALHCSCLLSLFLLILLYLGGSFTLFLMWFSGCAIGKMDLLIILKVRIFRIKSRSIFVVLCMNFFFFAKLIGARQPAYLVTADDVDCLLAIEVQPLDDRKRKVNLFPEKRSIFYCSMNLFCVWSERVSTGKLFFCYDNVM